MSCSLITLFFNRYRQATKVTADGEQTGQDAERTNERAKRLGEFIKGTLQAAEGIGKQKQNMPVASQRK